MYSWLLLLLLATYQHQNGRSSHLCESSQSLKTPTHVLCFFFTGSKYGSTALWNLQYSLFRLCSLYIQNSGFMFKTLPRTCGLFCAQTQLSMFITASQITIIWHPWLFSSLAGSLRLLNTWLRLLKAAYFLHRVLRWPKV